MIELSVYFFGRTDPPDDYVRLPRMPINCVYICSTLTNLIHTAIEKATFAYFVFFLHNFILKLIYIQTCEITFYIDSNINDINHGFVFEKNKSKINIIDLESKSPNRGHIRY